MTLSNLLLLTHVLGVVWLVGGAAARQVARSELHHTTDLKVFLALDALAGRYEDLMVRPGSTVVVASGLALALVQGWPLFGFLQGSSANWMLVSNLLVIGILLTIILIFIPRGKVYEQARQQAVAQGEITPELKRLLNDPTVRAAHIYEAAAGVLIIFLMIVKPF